MFGSTSADFTDLRWLVSVRTYECLGGKTGKADLQGNTWVEATAEKMRDAYHTLEVLNLTRIMTDSNAIKSLIDVIPRMEEMVPNFRLFPCNNC